MFRSSLLSVVVGMAAVAVGSLGAVLYLGQMIPLELGFLE